jgi:molybdopterin converting factor small subunit
MIVNVKFVGSFRSISGKDKLRLTLEGSTSLRNVIERMVMGHPKLEEAFIDRERDEPKTSMLILVDGKEISVLKGLDTLIGDGDEIVFVPVLHGG